MLEYANAFNCVVANNNSEVIVTFLQNVPQLDDDGAYKEMQHETVTRIAMSGDLARNLVATINDLLEKNEQKGN